MINGLYCDISKNLESELDGKINIKLWVCYFYISSDDIINIDKFETFDIKPTFITLTKHGFKNNTMYVKTDKFEKIDITKLYTFALFFSEDRDNCINMYNNLIYDSIDSLAEKMNQLKERYDTIIERINYSKTCFVETDYVMEKLTHE